MLKEIDRRIIRAFAQNDMNVRRTAISLYMARNTVLYHIEKIRAETGKDPRVFYDLCELLLCATEGRGTANKREGSL